MSAAGLCKDCGWWGPPDGWDWWTPESDWGRCSQLWIGTSQVQYGDGYFILDGAWSSVETPTTTSRDFGCVKFVERRA